MSQFSQVARGRHRRHASVVSAPPSPSWCGGPRRGHHRVFDLLGSRIISQVVGASSAPRGWPRRIGACLCRHVGVPSRDGFEQPATVSGLMFAEGAWPIPPTSSEARSLRMVAEHVRP